MRAPEQLRPLITLHLGELLGRDPLRPDHVVVAHRDTAFTDRPHRQLPVTGNANLADDDHVTRRTDRARHLEGDGHTAAREPDDDDRSGPVEDVGQRTEHQRSELSTGVGAIGEHVRIVRRREAPPPRPFGPRRYTTSAASTLIVEAMIAVPKRYDSSAWRRSVRRTTGSVTAVSDTWYVIPTVNARYAKSR